MTSLLKHQKHPHSLEPIKDFGHQFLHAKVWKGFQIIPRTKKKKNYDDMILTEIITNITEK
jgi:hypothetical protein